MQHILDCSLPDKIITRASSLCIHPWPCVLPPCFWTCPFKSWMYWDLWPVTTMDSSSLPLSICNCIVRVLFYLLVPLLETFPTKPILFSQYFLELCFCSFRCMPKVTWLQSSNVPITSIMIVSFSLLSGTRPRVEVISSSNKKGKFHQDKGRVYHMLNS